MAYEHNIKQKIATHLLADGMDIVVDFEHSEGSWLVDLRNGDRYLDCFSMFASMAVGFNHPELLAIQHYLGRMAVQKPANSDCYSAPMAEFVETFSRYAVPQYLPHAFFIEGGALGVENCLKAAFDWKVQKNFANGIGREKGQKIIHFQQAFHGRTGYTLSLTNTSDPRKTQYFPKFDWPRIINPKLSFPLTRQKLQKTEEQEQQAVADIYQWLEKDPHDIAAIIIEPIQGEGGDNHFRHEFFKKLRRICDEHELLLIFDEVQTGIGLTGKFWAHEHCAVKPDLLAFGKKTQVCGALGGTRIDEVERNVFTEPTRINSTFGGNLIDMIRCSTILKIIAKEQLVDNARLRGNELLQGLKQLALEFPSLVSNVRGLGLMCAFDLPDGKIRNDFIGKALAEKILLIGCGEKSIRFRPHLIISANEVKLLLERLAKALHRC
ncbi:L-lysine 6-transaminase [Desulforhopalus singaporensis]|uniref:L-lysine-epsilon aminotransferase n=1 Tax=Desulforhopalus singaporensis TaxID=91360 RepID=A0A1H0U7P9_9BACT|nr:L-lysine 6-transaminase [Desulforhopalus singaporensis]SDP62005.1 L-lysine 6-transaminase precursor [Desulforhopalus singaporensis]